MDLERMLFYSLSCSLIIQMQIGDYIRDAFH